MVTIYKPNAKNTGALVSFKVLSKLSGRDSSFKEGCVFLEFVRQTGWNNQNKTGSFKGGEYLIVKLNALEIADLINSIERRVETSFFHSFNGVTVQGQFRPWQDKESGEMKGFGLSLQRKSEEEVSKYNIGFRFNEATLIREYLKFSLEHIFSASYAEEKKRTKEYLAKNNGLQDKSNHLLGELNNEENIDLDNQPDLDEPLF